MSSLPRVCLVKNGFLGIHKAAEKYELSLLGHSSKCIYCKTDPRRFSDVLKGIIGYARNFLLTPSKFMNYPSKGAMGGGNSMNLKTGGYGYYINYI